MTQRPCAAPILVAGTAFIPAAEPTRQRAKALKPRGLNKWRMLDLLRPISPPRTQACRRRRISPTVQVQQMGDGSRRVSGVLSCGSVWGCPVCSQRICSHRADELQSVIKEWRGEVSMVTLTVRHGLGQSLKKIRKGVANAWRKVWQGKRAKLLRELFHVKHSIRALEVTHGENGWHPHLHVLVLGNTAPEPAALEYLRELWIAAVESELGEENAPDWSHGVVLSTGGGGSYLAKMGLEVTHHHTKAARRSSRTPWEIALDAIEGDEASAALWREYVSAMKGARQLTWSRGTRRFFGLGLRDSDAAIVEDAPPDPAAGFLLADWDGPVWDALVRSDPFWVSRLATAESFELEGLPGWARSVRVEDSPPPD